MASMQRPLACTMERIYVAAFPGPLLPESFPGAGWSDEGATTDEAAFCGGDSTGPTDAFEPIVALPGEDISGRGAVSTLACGTVGSAVFVTALGAGVVVLTAACVIAAGPSALAEKGLTGDGVPSLTAVGTAARGGLAPATA
jgi:hypothetical protein